MATAMQTDEWVVVPYGPDHRATMEAMVGGDYAPEAGRYGADWTALRLAAYGLRGAAGYGYNGIYLETFRLPDGRILIKRDDKYACYSKFRMFADRAAYDAWARSTERDEIDPETGRRRRK